MSSHETDRQIDEHPGMVLLAEPGDDVALGCESALPFLTPAEPGPPGETWPWAAPSSI